MYSTRSFFLIYILLLLANAIFSFMGYLIGRAQNRARILAARSMEPTYPTNEEPYIAAYLAQGVHGVSTKLYELALTKLLLDEYVVISSPYTGPNYRYNLVQGKRQDTAYLNPIELALYKSIVQHTYIPDESFFARNPQMRKDIKSQEAQLNTFCDTAMEQPLVAAHLLIPYNAHEGIGNKLFWYGSRAAAVALLVLVIFLSIANSLIYASLGLVTLAITIFLFSKSNYKRFPRRTYYGEQYLLTLQKKYMPYKDNPILRKTITAHETLMCVALFLNRAYFIENSTADRFFVGTPFEDKLAGFFHPIVIDAGGG